jgi:hypothetical protein
VVGSFGLVLDVLLGPEVDQRHLDTLIAPVELGIFYLRQPHVSWTVGTIGLVSTVCLMGFTTLSALKRTQWIVLLTHFFIINYWVWSFALIGAGV